MGNDAACGFVRASCSDCLHGQRTTSCRLLGTPAIRVSSSWQRRVVQAVAG